MNNIQSYVNEIPAEFPRAVFYSAYYSFVVSSLLTRSLRSGVNSAIVAASASAVGSVIMPLLTHQFGDKKKNLSWKALTISQISGLGFIQLMLRSLASTYQTHFFASAFFTLLALDISMSHDGFHARKKGPIFIFV